MATAFKAALNFPQVRDFPGSGDLENRSPEGGPSKKGPNTRRLPSHGPAAPRRSRIRGLSYGKYRVIEEGLKTEGAGSFAARRVQDVDFELLEQFK